MAPIQRLQREMVVKGYYTSEADKLCVVVLEVDQERIFKQLGPKARRNKSRKTSVLQGAIKVKILQEK